MTDFGIIYLLAGFTLLGGVGWGAWQMARARRATRRHEHSAFSEHRDR